MPSYNAQPLHGTSLPAHTRGINLQDFFGHLTRQANNHLKGYKWQRNSCTRTAPDSLPHQNIQVATIVLGEFDGKSQDRYAKIKPKFFLHDFLPGQFGGRIDFSRHVNDSRHFASEKKSLIVLLDVVGLTVFRQKKWKRRQASVQLGGISGLDELF